MYMTISAAGLYDGAKGHTEIIRALANDFARLAVKGTAVLTDNGGGAGLKVSMVGPVAAVANNGTNLAQKASTETALGTVKDALAELYAKANEIAVKLGITPVTYNGGGAAPDATIAAVQVATTAAATGCNVDATNAIIAAYNQAFYNLAALTMKLTFAVAVLPAGKVTVADYGDKGKIATAIAALSTDTGTAASPGVSKASMDAVLTKFRDSAHAVAAALNAVVAARTPSVLSVS